ncbi:TonB-dependent receptor [Fulvivirgaceae bacterium BMA12]|uniref:TonB-dependent receptor n=1 Tax=Agaribacillus aureus TaxID=3051825 RepID=A0ABT8LBW4_9BACT|nr:TonB-dependent receptor [Fulvivirgaceae bacterium BMA12]
MKNQKFILAGLFFFTLTILQGHTDLHASVGAQGSDIKGLVADETSKKPMEYATVALYHSVDSILITGVVTDNAGRFYLENILAGTYYLVADFLGYRKQTIPDIKVGLSQKTIDLGTIGLIADITQMEAIEITARKEAIEHHIDKDVINVDRQLNAAGGSAVEVLENHPSVDVDMDGNVTLRGNANFQVLINGKPTALDASQALQQMPASNLKKVEVITNPSAKYDADGSAGIINLITNNNEKNGFSGLMNGAIYSNDSYRGDLSLGYAHRKLSLTLEGNINQDRSRYYEYETSQRTHDIHDQVINQFITVGSNQHVGKLKQIGIGIDYSMNDKNKLSLFAKRGQFEYQFLLNEKLVESIGNDHSYFLIGDVISNNRNVTSIHFTDFQSFDTAGHQLEISANYFFIDYDRKNLQDQFNTDSSWNPEMLSAEIENGQLQTIKRLRIKADYVKPITEKTKLEAGLQARLDQRDARFLVASFSSGDLSDNSYLYHRNIYAAYYTLQSTWHKIDVKGGLRAEYVDRQMTIADGNTTLSLEKLQLFPSIYLTKKLLRDQQIQFNYSRKIVRPDDFQLNPFFYYTSRTNNWKGNPDIRPSSVNSFEFNYINNFGNSSLTAKTYFRKTGDAIQNILQGNEQGVTTGSMHNLDQATDLGIEISGDIEVSSWWNINTSFIFYRNSLQGIILEEYIDRTAHIWRSRLQTTFDLHKNTTLQLTGFYNGPSIRPQGKNVAAYAINGSLRQRLLNKKLILTLSANNLFNLRRFGGNTIGENFVREWDTRLKFPVYTFNISYKFNNFSKKDREEGAEGLGF